MHDLLNKQYRISSLATPTGSGGPVDFNATGDKWLLTFPHPVDVYRFGFMTIAAMTPDADGFQLDMDKRITIGSDTGRIADAGGFIFRPLTTGVVAAGSMVAQDVVLTVAAAVGSDGSIVNVDPAGPLRVTEGQELVLKVGNAVGSVSTGYIWVEYAQLPFNRAGNAKLVA